MRKTHIYYRHAAVNNHNYGRPIWFSYENCFLNLLETIKAYDIELVMALDGPIEGNFISKYTDRFTLLQTNYGSSLLSYRALLEYIRSQRMNSTDLIYFLENDYLHVDNWIEKVHELYNTFNGLTYVSLYDHNDKYFLPMYDDLVSKIIVTPTHHWRTTPSTCGSFIVTRDIFDQDYDVWSSAIGDHNTFLHLTDIRSRFVLTPLPGLSTHCMEGLMSPTIDWESINKLSA